MVKLQQHLLSLLALVLIPLGILGIYSYQQVANSQYQEAKTLQEVHLESIHEKMDDFLSRIQDDIFSLRDSGAVNLYLSALKSGDQESKLLMLLNLQSGLRDFSQKKQIYQQIRFLDNTGMDVVRVDQKGTNSQLMHARLFSNHKNEPDISDALTLPKDSLFISSIFLKKNAEGVELPITPTVRYITPVYANQRDLRGLLVMDVSADHLLKFVSDQDNPNGLIAFIDKQGFYFYHPDSNKRWGGDNDLKNGSNFYTDYPFLVNKVDDKINAITWDIANQLVSVQPVMVSFGHQKLGNLISLQPVAQLSSHAHRILWLTLLLMIISMLVIVYRDKLFSFKINPSFSSLPVR